MSPKNLEVTVARQFHASKREPEPDGGAGPQPGWLAQVPYLLVLATMSAGIVIVAAAHFKRGPALIAGGLLLGALFRALLPEHKVGMLRVRGRWFDVLTLVVLAAVLIVLAWVAPQL